MKIAIILGSTRPGRFGAQVADWVMGQVAGRAGRRFSAPERLRDRRRGTLAGEVPPRGKQQDKHRGHGRGLSRGSGRR